jgi:hypothetical protein
METALCFHLKFECRLAFAGLAASPVRPVHRQEKPYMRRHKMIPIFADVYCEQPNILQVKLCSSAEPSF